VPAGLPGQEGEVGLSERAGSDLFRPDDAAAVRREPSELRVVPGWHRHVDDRVGPGVEADRCFVQDLSRLVQNANHQIGRGLLRPAELGRGVGDAITTRSIADGAAELLLGAQIAINGLNLTSGCGPTGDISDNAAHDERQVHGYLLSTDLTE
jgi:hypothetical protein